MAIERKISLFNDHEISELLESVKGKLLKSKKISAQSVYPGLENKKILENALRNYSKKENIQKISNKVNREMKTLVYSFPDNKQIILHAKKDEPIEEENISTLIYNLKKKLVIEKTMPETLTHEITTEYTYPSNKEIIKTVLRTYEGELNNAEIRKEKF